MSEQRWAVMCSMTGSSWGVVRPEHVYREADGLLACTEWESLHGTWAEAMQEVDRMARTVTVTLPRGQLAWLSGLDSDGREYVTEIDGNEICYEPGGLGEIALRLLAYALGRANREAIMESNK